MDFQHSSKSRIVAKGALALLLAVVVSACDLLSTSDRAELVEVVIESQHLDGPVQVVSSRNFFFGISEETQAGGIVFITADTLTVPTPYENSYNMAPTYQLVVRAFPPPEALEVEEGQDRPIVYMRVFVDGREVFNAGQEMMDQNSYIEYYLMDQR